MDEDWQNAYFSKCNINKNFIQTTTDTFALLTGKNFSSTYQSARRTGTP
jgi:hypothetical protein